jgi:hypothetical protein
MTAVEQPARTADVSAEERMAAFSEQLKTMRVPGARPQGDRVLSTIAVVAMVVGVVMGVVAYFMSHGTTNELEQNDAIVLAILAATIAVVGVGLFVKKGVEQLLRFWIARVNFEQNTQTDRLLAQGEQLQALLRDLMRETESSQSR